MSTINAAFRQQLTVQEAFSADELPTAQDPSVNHNQANRSKTLSASTTPAGTEVYARELTGSQNLDLTALTDTLGNALDCSGLKLQAILLNNPSTTDAVVISDGAADPYSINGGSDITVPVGGAFSMDFNDELADVAAGAKAIDITPGAGESFKLVMVFG